MNNSEYLAILDRYIISKREELEKGHTLTVQVSDGYLLITSEIDEITKDRKVKTYFSEFDDKLNIPLKKVLDLKLKGVNNK